MGFSVSVYLGGLRLFVFFFFLSFFECINILVVLFPEFFVMKAILQCNHSAWSCVRICLGLALSASESDERLNADQGTAQLLLQTVNSSAATEDVAASLLAFIHSYYPKSKVDHLSDPPSAPVTLACPMRTFLGFCSKPAILVLKGMRKAQVLPQLSCRGSKFWQVQETSVHNVSSNTDVFKPVQLDLEGNISLWAETGVRQDLSHEW